MSSQSLDKPHHRQGANFVDIHSPDWHTSILSQLHKRKRIEQDPFEDICSFACSMFDRVDIHKSENIQLNLQKEKLQQELLDIQRAILTGGSDAAKAILSKLSPNPESAIATTDALVRQSSSLSSDKSLLEKKIVDLQEKLKDTLKKKADTAQQIIDLKCEVEEKERITKQLSYDLTERDKTIAELRDQCRGYQERLSILDDAHKTLNDEHIALSLTNKSLEKKHYQLKLECEQLRVRILEIKREDADRLNAENERNLLKQQEKIKKGIEANLNEMNKAEQAKIAANDPTALAIAAMSMNESNFESQESEDTMSRIPSIILTVFDAHEGDVDALNWFCKRTVTNDFLATGGSDRKVKLWKIVNNAARSDAVLLGSNASITSIDTDNDVLLASSNDMASRIWSLSDYKLKRTLTGHSARVLSAKFLGAPNKIASGSHDRTLKIWDINKNACTRTYFAGSTCNDLIYQNYMVISGHFDKKIRYWDLKSQNQEPVDEVVLQSKITSLDIDVGGNLLLCSVRDDTIKTLDLRTKQVLHTYSADGFKIGADYCRAKFSMDGSLIACGSNDGTIFIWNTQNSKLERTLKPENNGHTTLACCWCPDRKRMASIEKSKRVTIFG